MDQLSLYLFAAFALFLAGTIKGVVGLGLPTTSIALLTLAVDIRVAIALAILPMLVSNAWQVHRAGELRRSVRTYWPFVAALMLALAATVASTVNASDAAVMGALGAVLLLYVATSVSGWRPAIPAAADRPVQLGAGALSGVMGGLVGVWAPPMALYLAARGTQKDEFVRATGLILFCGSIPLLIGYVRAGFLEGALIWFSIALLVPTFAGFALGERLRGRLSERGFRAALMVFFALVGLNLIRRALF
ncbi:putative membrane protein [Candidatus Rhodobacter oscarellae]|uniref:Probable membrane transporter protein n=1 Tax=Candidatus Rhodobacter oscarellae TaxID=1675527 RepID=A0A0J9GUA3_9RHOB|nr:putative membrane protein [Candidatus Rhodobacter lobularis]